MLRFFFVACKGAQFYMHLTCTLVCATNDTDFERAFSTNKQKTKKNTQINNLLAIGQSLSGQRLFAAWLCSHFASSWRRHSLHSHFISPRFGRVYGAISHFRAFFED